DVRHPDVGPVEGQSLREDAAAKVPSNAPSLARSLVTVLPPPPVLLFVTQMLAPSKPRVLGWPGTAKLVVWFASYQCRMATCLGFLVELVTSANAKPHQARARVARMIRRIVFDNKVQSPKWASEKQPMQLGDASTASRLSYYRCSPPRSLLL